jgi:phenylacetate-CoA ligase
VSGAYTRFVSNVVFPMQESLKKHTTTAVRRAMEESQWWDTERLRKHQAERLRSFLANVATHVPYYRRLFDALGFRPETVKSTADLVNIPFLTKALIRSNMDSLKADDATHLTRFNTGGSSGEPLIFFIGTERVSHDVAAKWRATRWWNVDIGDPEIVVWG